MASPVKLGEVGTLDSQIFDLHLDVTTTTGGLVPNAPAYKKGITSIVRNGAGDYTLTLVERWNRLVSASAEVLIASYTSTKGCAYTIKSEAVNSTTPTVRIVFTQVSGAAADVDDGARLFFQIRVANSDV